MYLPASGNTETGPREQPRRPAARGAGERKHETILIVDDEVFMQNLLRDLLEAEGHTVLAADTGEQSIEVFDEHGARISLVIMDLLMPGMGGAITGSSFTANSHALADIRLNMRVVHECIDPDTHFEFFGSSLSTPIMNGPMAGPNSNCGPIDDLEFEVSLLKGTTQAGSLGWIGDPAREEFFMNGCKAIEEAGTGVVISKPHYDNENVRLRFQWGKDAGATAFGMDLDGAGILHLKTLGYPVGPKSVQELKIIRSFMPSNPFIIKGIMTADDALRCRDAGVDCIVVSNHGGRVLDGTHGVAEVLPEIAQAVGNDIVILAHGAVRSGVHLSLIHI